jgi:hypothetical protein
MFQEIVQSSQFFYDNEIHYMCNDTGRIIVGEHLPFLLGILNSNLFFYSVKKYYGGGILGEHGIRMKHTFFGNFPCLPYNEQVEKMAIKLSEKNADSMLKEESDINRLIYKLYGLTYDEVLIIDPTPPFTREEYETDNN